MATVFLDVDDEITSAAARIRTAEDVELAIVLPAGSRIATSRINFRLLAHEATTRSRRLSIVAPEASARALAASAGLPVFATVAEYEEARGGGPEAPPEPPLQEPPRPPARDSSAAAAGAAVAAAGAASAGLARGGAPARACPVRACAPRAGAPARPAEPPAATTTAGSSPQPSPGAEPAGGGRPQGEAARPRGAVGASTGLGGVGASASRPRRRRWPLVLASLLAVGILGSAGAAVGYVLLPTATVELTLAAEPVGPISFVAVADPDAVTVDVASATIPATRISFPLSATGSFEATGKRVETTRAAGQVRWTNCDPTRAYTIPRGTVARTPSGIAFATQEAVFVPVAIIDPPRITCSNRTVDVLAAREGPAGNVAAGTITVVPGEYNDVVVKVVNPAATSGGTREEFPTVVEKDVAAAIATLTKQLDAQLAEVAADPPGTPEGATVYPETARRGEPTPSEPASEIVGREVATFELTLTAEGTVVAADPAPIEELAQDRIAAEVPDGMTLREGSTRTTIGSGEAAGETILYPVTASAEAVREISEEEVRTLVKGATPAEAEEALAPYGTVEVVLWPDWVTTITTVDARLTVSVEGVPPAEPTVTPAADAKRRSAGIRQPAPGRIAAGDRRPVTRLLGIDLGTRRVGLAIAEEGDLRARPLTTIAAPADHRGRCRGAREDRGRERRRRARRGVSARHAGHRGRDGGRDATMGPRHRASDRTCRSACATNGSPATWPSRASARPVAAGREGRRARSAGRPTGRASIARPRR